MKHIEELLAQLPLFAPLSEDARAVIAGCGRNRGFRDGEYILREGEREDRFYVIRAGAVALELYVPQRGALVIETLEEGDPLGWSWLFPPYTARFDARAVGAVHTIEFDGACLRGKCDADPVLGYELMKLFGGVIVERLQYTRLRLLDVYAPVAGG
jgi:CRP/FNR family transcriptional regulator, cyclic AMP receptor protein